MRVAAAPNPSTPGLAFLSWLQGEPVSPWGRWRRSCQADTGMRASSGGRGTGAESCAGGGARAPGSGARPHGADLPLGKTLSAHPLGRGPARLRKLRPALPGPRPPPLTSPPAPCWIFCCSWATRRRAPSICSSRWLPGFWLCASQMRWGQAGVRQVTPQPWGEMGSPPPRRSTSFHPHLGAKQGGNGEKRMREAIEKGRGHEPPAPGLP